MQVHCSYNNQSRNLYLCWQQCQWPFCPLVRRRCPIAPMPRTLTRRGEIHGCNTTAGGALGIRETCSHQLCARRRCQPAAWRRSPAGRPPAGAPRAAALERDAPPHLQTMRLTKVITANGQLDSVPNRSRSCHAAVTLTAEACRCPLSLLYQSLPNSGAGSVMP